MINRNVLCGENRNWRMDVDKENGLGSIQYSGRKNLGAPHSDAGYKC